MKTKTSTSSPVRDLTNLIRDEQSYRRDVSMDCLKKKRLLLALILVVSCGIVVVLLESIFELRLFSVTTVDKDMIDLLANSGKNDLGLDTNAETQGSENKQIEKSGNSDKINKVKPTKKTGTIEANEEAEKDTHKQAAGTEMTEQHSEAIDKNVSGGEKLPQSGDHPSETSDKRNPIVQDLSDLESSKNFWLFEAACLLVSISGYAFVKQRQHSIDRAFLEKVNRQIDGV